MKRTAAESKKRYERTWLDALAVVNYETKRGNKNVAQILDNYNKHAIRTLIKNKFFHDVHKKLGLSAKRKQLPAERLAVIDGAYTIVPIDLRLNTRLVDILAQFLNERRNQVDCVVELGSGIGRNLFFLAHKLDPQLRKRIMFYACEFTTSGKEVCASLRELESDLCISIEHFDYYQPDFAFLPEKKNIVFFSCHSIEQIPVLNRKVIEEMSASSDRCFCFHAEPVGWQYVDDLRRQRELMSEKPGEQDQSFLKRKIQKADRKFFLKLGIGFLDSSQRFGVYVDRTDIGESDRVSVNAAKWSLAKDYNTNLVSLLKDMEREGLISIDTEKINLFGDNPFNPTTLVAWSKAYIS